MDSVIAGVERGQIPREQYGALLIDEGHDFEEHWLRLVVEMIDRNTNSLLLLYDDAQSIYRRSSLGFSLSSAGVQARGRTKILKLNYRNTREILTFAYEFAKDYLQEKNADDDHVPLVVPKSAGVGGPKPIFRRLDSFEEEPASPPTALRNGTTTVCRGGTWRSFTTRTGWAKRWHRSFGSEAFPSSCSTRLPKRSGTIRRAIRSCS